MEINYDGTLYFQLELYFLILKRWLQLNVYIYELGMLRKKKYRAKIFFKSRFFFLVGGNPMDGGAWWAAVHGVAKSWT